MCFPEAHKPNKPHYYKLALSSMNHDSIKIRQNGLHGYRNNSWSHYMKVKPNLAKAKSRGLTHILGHEKQSTLEKSWEEIKDLLRLKLCNANIHTLHLTLSSTSNNQEKECHLQLMSTCFKTEAKWYNFTNDAATITIFIKGLRNAHSLARMIYEKDYINRYYQYCRNSDFANVSVE